MPALFQVLAAVLGLAFVAVIAFTLLYIANDLEDTPFRPLGRFFKALVGGVTWAAAGILVAAGLFGISIVIWAIFFRPVFSIYILQYNATWLGLAVIGFYLIWGIYHGARNRLPLSYSFQRQPR